MDIFLNVLEILGIILGVILLLLILFLLIPVSYEIDCGTNNKSTFLNMKVRALCSLVSCEVLNDLVLLRIFGFIKIKLSSNEKKDKLDINDIDELKDVDPNSVVPADSSLFRKLKLKVYIAERKLKEKAYKFRKTVNDINEYKYKMELLKKTIDFVFKILKLVKPKEYNVCVEMGCGSYDLTGKLVGMLSTLKIKYPNLTIVPNFDKATLTFNVYARGNIMLIKALIIFFKFSNEQSVKEIRAMRKERKNA